MESNDSPEIPDREETSDIPGLPSRDFHSRKKKITEINWFEKETIMTNKKLPKSFKAISLAASNQNRSSVSEIVFQVGCNC